MQTSAITCDLLNGSEHTVAQMLVITGERCLEGSAVWATIGLNISSIRIADGLILLGYYQAVPPPGCVTQRPSGYKCRRDQIVWKESTSVIIATLNYK